MPRTRVVVDSRVVRSARVMQLEGLFAVPPSERTELAWDVDMPLDEKPWSVGLIVGASGSGKSTVARHLWPEPFARVYEWDRERSLLDSFPKQLGIKAIVELLSSVGFSSPPAWVRPFHVLSTGEQFRVSMARALAESHVRGELLVVDEFTSVVDRTVAQIGSAAIARTARARGQQFVAVTCHEDVEPWLQPDWVYRPSLQRFDWRSLQRPPQLDLTVQRVSHAAWSLFRGHHYLDSEMNAAALVFVASMHGQPVALSGALGFPHPYRPGWRLSRLVCLPDFQGVGIGVALADFVASVLRRTGKPVFRTAAHPAVVAHCARSTRWRMSRQPSLNPAPGKGSSITGDKTVATHRLTAGFEYVGPPAELAHLDALMPEWSDRARLHGVSA